MKDVKFLCLDYKSNIDGKGESLQFIFYGGKLSESEIKNIKIDWKEIIEYRFMRIKDALPLLSEKLALRLPKCLVALKNNTAFYFEDGK